MTEGGSEDFSFTENFQIDNVPEKHRLSPPILALPYNNTVWKIRIENDDPLINIYIYRHQIK